MTYKYRIGKRLRDKRQKLRDKENSRKSREDIKKYLNLIKESRKCEVCGEGRAICLDFHHKNRQDKDLTFGDIRVLSIAKIRKEISKCMIVCANCHRIIHATEQLKQVEQAIKDKKLPLFDP